MTMLIGARAYFCAAHNLPAQPDLHGHSYEVWVYVPEEACVNILQERVAAACKPLGCYLNSFLAGPPTMENIARFIAERIPEAVKIVISRPLEGVTAEWTI